jgi:hypothetical protein
MEEIRVIDCERWMVVGMVGSSFLAFGAPARSEIDPAEKACPEAFVERAELRARLPRPKDATNVTRPALRKELLEMEQLDQEARKRFIEAIYAGGGDVPMNDPARVAVIHVDDDINLPKLKHIVTQEGFPTIAMVGLDGVQAAFLLIQHADSAPQFQARMLTVISRRLRTGEINRNQYALLTDRVLQSQGKPQRYGTQFQGEGDQLKPLPIEDEAHVDQRRHALGLMSLANYACIVHARDR